MAEASRSDPETSENEEIQSGDLARMVKEGREEEVVEYLAAADRNDQQWQRELDECVVMAIQHKQAGIMKHLVEAGADLKTFRLGYRDDFNQVLHNVFWSRDVTIIDIFVTHFKDDIVEHVCASRNGIYLLVSAIEGSDLQSVKTAWSMLQELDIELGEHYCETSPIYDLVNHFTSTFHDSSSFTSVLEEILAYFLDKGYDINCTDSRSRTPLHRAAEHGCIAGIRVLMEHGADPFAQDDEDYYPGTYACDEEHYDAMKELLQGVDPDEHGEMFESLLHKACQCGWEQGVRYLLDRGVDVNCTDELNRTPLSYAVQVGPVDLVQCLVNHNRCDVKSNCGVAMRNVLQCVHRLRKLYDDDEDDTFYDGYRYSYTSKEAYVRKNLDPNIRCLIQAGASVNLPDENGHTLLMDSAICKEKCCRDFLLQHGADVNAVARDGCSVLWMAVSFETYLLEENRLFAAVKDLLAQNIDVGVTQHQHQAKTPLQAAFDQRHHALCNLLLDADCSVYGMNEYLTSIQDKELEQQMEEVRTRILKMYDQPYSLKVQARLAVLRAIGQGDLRENLLRIHRAGLLPNVLVNYLGKAINFNMDRI